MKGRLHRVETLGALDGPGLRTVFFLQGCNMKCLYCHNRDSWDCSGGREISKDEILRTVRSNRSYYGRKGGVTFSGGEPLLQSAFLLEVVSALKNEGIHTAIDTSGSVFSSESGKLIDLADLVILDIKHSDSSRFRELCGISDDNLRKNLQYLQKGKTAYWIRQVIVEGYTDGLEQIDELSSMIFQDSHPEKWELLPYHTMGLEKWKQAGDCSLLKNVKPPTQALMDQLKSRLCRSSTESRK